MSRQQQHRYVEKHTHSTAVYVFAFTMSKSYQVKRTASFRSMEPSNSISPSNRTKNPAFERELQWDIFCKYCILCIRYVFKPKSPI